MKDLSVASPWGRFLASPINIRLSWKGLPRTNTLAYFEKSLLIAVKSFITLATGGKLYKTFSVRNLRISVVARVFIPCRPFQSSLLIVGKAKTRV